MSEHLSVSWHLSGEINDHNFTLSGEGTANLRTGATELRLAVAPSLPTGYDPGLAHMICNFALAGYTAVPDVAVSMRDAVSSALHVRPRRQVVITDAAGEPVTRLEALTTLQLDGPTIAVTNYMTGYSRLPAPVASVSGEESLVPGPDGTATGVARYTVVLTDGSVLDGLTVVPYRFDRTDITVTPARRTLKDHGCAWTSQSELRLWSSSEWVALNAAARAAGA